MPAGLRIDNGGSVFEVTDATRLVRLLGIPFFTGTNDGFVEYPEWNLTGYPFFFVYFTRAPNEMFAPPTFRIEGNRLYWQFPPNVNRISTKVVAGVHA